MLSWFGTSIPSFIIIIIHFLCDFLTPAVADGLLIETEWLQVSWTILSIIDNLNNAEARMVLVYLWFLFQLS